MKIISLKQRDKEWYIYRQQGIGSSDIVTIMGLNPFKKPVDVYNEKLGLIENNHTNSAMKRGIDYEDEALTQAMSLLGVELKPCCVEDTDHTYIRASLDGYSKENNLLIEIKVPTEKNYFTQSTQVIASHYCQVQWQMMITKSNIAYLYVYSPESKDGVLHPIEAAPIYQIKLLEVAIDFWKNNILLGTPPNGSCKDIEEVFDLEALELTEELESILDSKKRQEAREREIKKRLCEFGSNKDFKCGKFTIKLCEGFKTLDKMSMKNDGIDLIKYEIKGNDFWKIERIK